jgi:ATP-dependent helicase Lhr and Lhr-like helicase
LLSRGPGCRVFAWIIRQTGVTTKAARQIADYIQAVYKALGVVPSQNKLVLERFFDESGGMQLILHAPFGSRMNRAWGLALRKRFCRSFNFELQAAATEDAIILSLGTQHSFPLEGVFRYLHSGTVREVLVQALLDAPMFPIRWRWNCTRSLAVPRLRGSRKNPAPIQRMEAENLLAAVFPDQLACLEHIVGDREIPDHPLVRQTIEDCLTEAMDIDGLMLVLQRIEREEIECIARDLPQPSPLAHEILNARPYAFLDNAPLEERRTRAVYTRRASELNSEGSLGILDATAIENVSRDAWPRATNADELHDALLVAVLCTEDELNRIHPETAAWRELLAEQKRAGSFQTYPAHRFWLAAERLPLVAAVYGSLRTEPRLEAPATERSRAWEREEALRELVRGRMEISGPVTTQQLATTLALPEEQIQTALVALEAEGFVLRGQFHPHTSVLEWCDRRLLSRIHRLTITRLRAEIQPVSIADFLRFLTRWQRVSPERQAEGPDGVLAAIASLDGFEIPAGTWEPAVLALRVKDYQPAWLDHQCVTGRVGWGRLIPPQSQNGRPSAPVRSSPLSIFLRENLPHWLALAPGASGSSFPPDTAEVLHMFQEHGALFFSELLKRRSLMPSRVEQALGALVAQGCVTADTFEGLRALLVPSDKKVSFAETSHRRRHKGIASVEFAGRWALLRDSGSEPGAAAHEEAVEAFAHALLRRYGVVFRRLLERESLKVTWYELGRIFRRLEARGEIRGGYFVTGVGGEQFALPEAVGLLRSTRKDPATGEHIVISGSDPLNLAGILTPGKRIAALGSNRLLLVDGFPVAGLEGKEILPLDQGSNESADLIARSLRVGHMPGPLKRYYAR